jgi:hypothetical protein
MGLRPPIANRPLDKGLDAAQANGWMAVGMKNDWSRVFAFE